MKKLKVDEAKLRGRINEPPGIVKDLNDLVGKARYSLNAEVEVAGKKVTFSQSQWDGKVSAQYLLQFPATLENRLHEKTTSSENGSIDDWLDGQPFEAGLDRMGYVIEEEWDTENLDGYYLLWGIGIQIRLCNIVNLPATLAKIQADMPEISQQFDVLCKKALLEI
jgi:hypothetical protein